MNTIRCNNVPRPVLYWYELTDKERAEFDYIDTVEKQQDARFMRYKNWCYDLGEFMYIAPHAQRTGWEKFDGYHVHSYFSAVLVKYVDQCESVIAATAFS